MTRKCAICKETNYKNLSSFFSAPKDPETRKLWQDAIGLDNFVVKDETYVCSKHFYPTDIITHWFSGVPPNVITIKYKKFRLKPGAVPKISIEPDEIDPQFIVCDNEFEVNRTFSPLSKPSSSPFTEREETFSIPRADIGDKNVKTIDFDDQDSQHSLENVLEYLPDQNSQNTQTDYISKENTNHHTQSCLEKGETPNSHNTHDLEENHSDIDTKLLESDNSFITSRSTMNNPIYFTDDENKEEKQKWDNESNLSDSENKDDIKNSFKVVKVHYSDDQIMSSEGQNTSFNSSNLSNETMLFEDLLEIYTEVNLPNGWISFVISKGHGTTIVYSSTKINQSGIPVIEKQVFVKNNMMLQCSVKDKSIDPLMYNFIKADRNLKVQTLMDVEELIIEFNERQICYGNPVKNHTSIEAFRDGCNWRHASCPLIINNGLSKCSKCASLGKRKLVQNSNFDDLSFDNDKFRLVKRQDKIEALNELIEEQITSSKGEDRLPTLHLKTIGLLSEAVDLLKLPAIQKLMIKECFKFKNYEKDKRVQFSRTWIFLCLLLYIESPEMYRYMLLNKYMNLPPLFTVKSYLRRVKADREFYKIFQESVETFQPFNEELKAGKSK